jgi:hypothetical protein
MNQTGTARIFHGAELRRRLGFAPRVKRRIGFALVFGVSTAFGLTAMGAADEGHGSRAAPAAARTFDRAYLCTNDRFRGRRTIEVVAKTGFRESGSGSGSAMLGSPTSAVSRQR